MNGARMTGQMERKADRHDEDGTTQDVIDFKMVTFSLGGKDYGIDIMRIKEIAKFQQFTYVPNTAPFVRGVYNLRGDIISIIDLRMMFNLPVEEKPEGHPENGLILRLDYNQLGVVVDSIDKVVGFSSQQIQPPHPIFGDINIKFISGVVEHQDRLYIILDVDRIFRRDDEPEKPAVRSVDESVSPEGPDVESVHDTSEDGSGAASGAAPVPDVEESATKAPEAERADPGINRNFIQEGLTTFASFQVTRVNDQWFTNRVADWEISRKGDGQGIQLVDKRDADAFLAPFWSRCTGSFWDQEQTESVKSLLPDVDHSIVHVWNPGCGGGHESYSLAVLFRQRYPERQIKIWAGDTDLMKISTAPNLVFPEREIPSSWSDYVTQTRNGLAFNSDVKDSILFEYSDVLNGTSLPPMDIIICRDLVSFLPPASQEKCLAVFEEVLKPSGLLMLGENEQPLDMSSWELMNDSKSLYRCR